MEKILKVKLNSVPSPLVKIQIMGGKVSLSCKGKTLLGVVNKLLKTKTLVSSPSNVLPYYFNQTFPTIIWIFTEGDLSSWIFSTLTTHQWCSFIPGSGSIIIVFPMTSKPSIECHTKVIPFWTFCQGSQIFSRSHTGITTTIANVAFDCQTYKM